MNIGRGQIATWPRFFAVLMIALLLSSALTAASPANAAASDPWQWATDCSAAKLGLEKDTVDWARVLNGDLKPDGRAVSRSPAKDGSWYPVVMVHGWTASATISSPTDRSGAFSHLIDLRSQYPFTAAVPRSLIGQLQDLPGAAVFTFDYHPYSGRWIDDSHLGPALGKVIDCLYKASGQKVVIVGHSMGGLVARWAATNSGISGTDRSAEISTVVTLGTPETGSIIAGLVDGISAAAASSSQVVTLIRTLLSVCGKLSSQSIETGTICDWFPLFFRAFSGDAGIALRAGSAQLAALKPWPKGINIDAISGDTVFEVPQNTGWFALPWNTTKIIGSGDMIVTKSSATEGATSIQPIECQYQFSAVRGATNQIGVDIGLVAISEISRIQLNTFSGACFHTDLMRDIQATNEALGAVNDDISSRLSVPGFPAELKGKWCSHLNPDNCFSIADKKARFPDLFVAYSGPAVDAPGATDYQFCIEHVPGNSCPPLVSMGVRYYPTGIGWDCSKNYYAEQLPTCDPDYSAAHDITKPRIIVPPNHQQDRVYHDSEPMYLVSGN
ncbi:alpha/beta fold hydrolase [Pseudarthrobacter sp. AB1]|uniref:esterase/lipase family protein n=1 Tax=Pseudarthrobacter sp. AB1 TaxID=2138309 RepID=UPI00186BB1F6|nr:alpha/beta fold hydrolase [Pseudarthrobacter sp. AB1]MBE4716586.1 hypothetical protein [Pseudarthrobacter sp. AB1]